MLWNNTSSGYFPRVMLIKHNELIYQRVMSQDSRSGLCPRVIHIYFLTQNISEDCVQFLLINNYRWVNKSSWYDYRFWQILTYADKLCLSLLKLIEVQSHTERDCSRGLYPREARALKRGKKKSISNASNSQLGLTKMTQTTI